MQEALGNFKCQVKNKYIVAAHLCKKRLALTKIEKEI